MKTEIITISLLVVIAFLLGLPAYKTYRMPGNKKSAEKHAIMQLVAALQSYRSEYGQAPGGDEAAILRALTGDNPRKIVYFEPARKTVNSSGQLIDRWGTPYRMTMVDSDLPHISSAGKNQKFETENTDSDDILSWR